MAEEDPWARFNPQPAPDTAAAGEDPWAKYNPQEAEKPQRSALQRAGEAAGETIMSGARAIARPFMPPSKEEAQKYLGPSGIVRGLTEAGETIMSPLTIAWGLTGKPAASLLASGTSEAARLIARGDPRRSEEMYGYAEPIAEAALSAAGPFRAKGVPAFPPGTRTPHWWRAQEEIVQGQQQYKTPRKPTPESEAAQYIQGEALDPAAFRSKLAQPPQEIVPGSKPTTFQHTQDPGLGPPEMAAETRNSAEFRLLREEQNAARLKALDEVQKTGSPQDATQLLRDSLRAEDAAGEQAIQLARQDAFTAAQQVGGTYDPTIYGNVIRRELQQAYELRRENESALWNAVDPQGTLTTNIQPLQELERSIYAPTRMTQAAAASLSAEEKKIIGLIQNYRPATLFREVTDLRSLVSSTMREELYTRGQTPVYGRLSRLRSGIEGIVDNAFNEAGQLQAAAGQRLRAASAATRERRELFEPLKDVTRREGTQGPYRMGEASIPGRILKPGPQGYDTASSFLRAVGNERGLDVIRDAAAADMRAKVMPDDVIDPKKLRTWTQQHQGVLRAITERDGGAFEQMLRNVGATQEAVMAAEAKQAAAIKARGKDEFRQLTGLVDDADISRTLGALFQHHDPVRMARELMSRTRSSPAAQDGLRRAIIEHMQNKFVSNAPTTQGDPMLRAEQIQNFINRNGQALSIFFSPKQVGELQAIVNDLRRMNLTVGTKVRGRSSTVQEFAIQQEQQRRLRNLAGYVMDAAIDAGLMHIGAPPFRTIVRGVTKGIRARSAQQQEEHVARLEQIVDKAMLDPEFAQSLFNKTSKLRWTPKGWQVLGYEATTQGQQQRAPRQAGGGVPAIGGTGGRSTGATTPAGARAARQGPAQALQDGGAAGDREADQGIEEGQFDPTARGAVNAGRSQKQLFPVPKDQPHLANPSTNQPFKHPPKILRGELLVPPGGWKMDPGFPIKQWPIPGGHRLAEGGEVEQPQGFRERLSAGLSSSLGGTPAGSGAMTGGTAKIKGKMATPPSRQDVYNQLRQAGITDKDILGTWADSRTNVDSRYARGGPIEEEAPASLEEEQPASGGLEMSDWNKVRRDPGEYRPNLMRPEMRPEEVESIEGWRGPTGRRFLQEGGEVPELPPAVVEGWGDPFERAAARTRQSVKPEGGRQEGLATKMIEGAVPYALSLPERFTKASMGAAEGDPERFTGREPFELGQYMVGMGPRAGAAGSVVMAGRRGPRLPPVSPELKAGEVPAADRPVTRGHNMPPEEVPVEPTAPAVPKTTGVGRMRALRELPYDEAMARAKTEQHLIPREGGGYEGAPDWVKTPEDLARLRAHLDEQARKGVAGRTWYERGQAGVEELAGPDPALQRLSAREKALFSPKASPETNLGFAIQAHNAYEAGKPLDVAYTGQQARTYKKGREAGELPLGKKTGPYASHLNPQEETPAIPVNDSHHMANFGYERPEGGASPTVHAFMDAETLLAADRANQTKLGGHSDWTPGRVQAAAWVEAKAQQLMRDHGWDYERAMADAMNAYIEHFPKHTAYGTHEATPGIGTRHLPRIAEGTEAERRAFAVDPRSFWRDTTGRDIFYRSLGMWTRPTTEATGIFRGPKGQEVNPAEVARPMVSFAGPAGDRSVGPADRAMMNAAEAARAYVDVQNMGAWSKPIPKQKTGVSTSLFAQRPGGGPLPIGDIGKLQEIGGRHGLPEVIDYGEGTALTSFGGGPTGRQLGKSTIPQETEGLLGGRPQQVKLDTGSIDYEALWGKKEGTGAVTRELKRRLTNPDAPAIIAKLDSNMELRRSVAAKMERDAEIAAQTGQPIRADVQLARKIITEEGFAGLFRALKAGAALPAAAFVPLLQLLQQGEDVNRGE